ncbi:hypothetical protein M422DRAFT_256399 [Sphaerobolus stellatus SS14]|uniref:Uncharacterized protein n=1 Tax=Sphaerobolus stellatus (strain SS14) TaxID=990650 RepID=A0A0C9V0U4_SPHS4|nr:hypothetical protein M422DRAFT_256399 [Sphaerobolus stellatus SS14]
MNAYKLLSGLKNYDGYWNGELFVKQLKEWFFPAFEKAHGPGYQALVMVNNSQGHSAYAADASVSLFSCPGVSQVVPDSWTVGTLPPNWGGPG